MKPLYLQLFGVIGVILILGSLGILRALAERLDRAKHSFPGRTGVLGIPDEEVAIRLAEEIHRRRSGAEVEDTSQQELEHK